MENQLSDLSSDQRPKPGMRNPETLSDLLNRLKRYNPVSKSFKPDLLSVPYAIQMVLRLFPHKYCRSEQLKRNILKAFVVTIIPGADEDDEYLSKMYEDTYYPFHTYCGYFVYDLNTRSKKIFNEEFVSLTPDERTEVIQNALKGRELTRRLYKGAILMAQVSFFGAVYNEERGCSLIDFPGKNNGYNQEKITYPFAADYFDLELSADGHPW